MRSVLPSVVFLGCVACAGYQPGSFTGPQESFVGPRTTIGCLDVSVAQRLRAPRTAVLEYDFANRCDHATLVDLAAVRVIGRTAAGRDVPLAAHDPDREIRPLPLDGRSTGHEVIAYEGDDVERVCIDVGAIGHAPAPWVCIAPRRHVSEVTP
jgi:hypothetical protein